MPKEHLHSDYWIQKIASEFAPPAYEAIRQAVILARLVGADRATPLGHNCFAQGLEMATILLPLHLDKDTLIAAILYSSVQYAGLTLEDVTAHVGIRVTKLISGAQQMLGINELHEEVLSSSRYQYTIDNMRKMLLAMVDDIRVVLLKLAEHLSILRDAAILNATAQNKIATAIMAVYAPLANRLGISKIKWELEDLAFRYLEPKKYHKIATKLAQKFPEREHYIEEVKAILQKILANAHIKNFQISGRVKHIYSIYRKMQRKKVGVDSIYDVTAIRILVPTITACYTTLSHVHATWDYLTNEFDDYIASPKPNGYRSIHTAIYGPKNHIIEIQIRTYEMHRTAELGIAAHWVYKEGRAEAVAYETKIAWLRQVMDWQQEIIKIDPTQINISQIFNDRVYVFTPHGDILDLPQGATPIDFAYRIHSEIGHRCCGAKINGNIVPLTYTLKTGDRVEILTGKDSHPSRDWLIPSLGFLYTSGARAKVLHWFKKQNQEQALHQGEELVAKEIAHLGLKKIDYAQAARKLKFKTTNDMLSAIGSGAIKVSNILQVLNLELEHPEKTKVLVTHPEPTRDTYGSAINVYGVSNLLTRSAACCNPVPQEPIVGYITQNKGVSIHKQACINILQAQKFHPERVIPVTWNTKVEQYYPVKIIITALDRPGLVRDITDILAQAAISLSALNCTYDKKDNLAKIKATIAIANLPSLSQILNRIATIPNVMEVRRSN